MSGYGRDRKTEPCSKGAPIASTRVKVNGFQANPRGEGRLWDGTLS